MGDQGGSHSIKREKLRWESAVHQAAVSPDRLEDDETLMFHEDRRFVGDLRFRLCALFVGKRVDDSAPTGDTSHVQPLFFLHSDHPSVCINCLSVMAITFFL